MTQPSPAPINAPSTPEINIKAIDVFEDVKLTQPNADPKPQVSTVEVIVTTKKRDVGAIKAPIR